jgi:hypothetical protein
MDDDPAEGVHGFFFFALCAFIFIWDGVWPGSSPGVYDIN